MLIIWFVKVLNLSQIWLRLKQDVDNLIYESIKFEQDLSKIFEQDLSEIWFRFKQDVDNLIYKSIKSEQNIWVRYWWFDLLKY